MFQILKHTPYFAAGFLLAHRSNSAKCARLEKTAVAARVGNVDADLLETELLLKDDEKETWVLNQEDSTDRLPWLNLVIKELWPHISVAVAAEVKAAVRSIMEGMNLPLSLRVQEFTLGDKAPVLTMELNDKADVMASDTDTDTITLDVGLKWDGDPDIKLAIKLGVLPVTVELKNLKLTDTVLRVNILFDGTLPVVKCITLMMLSTPQLDFDLDLLGLNLSKHNRDDTSMVQQKVQEIIQNVLDKLLVFPSYMGPIVINVPINGAKDAEGNETIMSMVSKIVPPVTLDKYNYLRPLPIGYLYVRPVRASGKAQADLFTANDSYVEIELTREPRGTAFRKHKSSVINNENTPDWSQKSTPEPFVKFMVCSMEKKVQGFYTVRLYDEDVGKDDFLGESKVSWGSDECMTTSCTTMLQTLVQPTLERVEDVDLRKGASSSGNVTVEHMFVPFGRVRAVKALNLPGVATTRPTSVLVIVLSEYRYFELYSQAHKDANYISQDSETQVNFRVFCDCTACTAAQLANADSASCPHYQMVKSTPKKDTLWPKWANEVFYIEGCKKEGLNLEVLVVDVDESLKSKKKGEIYCNRLVIPEVVKRIQEKTVELRAQEKNENVIYTFNEALGTGEYLTDKQTGAKFGGRAQLKMDLVWRETEYI